MFFKLVTVCLCVCKSPSHKITQDNGACQLTAPLSHDFAHSTESNLPAWEFMRCELVGARLSAGPCPHGLQGTDRPSSFICMKRVPKKRQPPRPPLRNAAFEEKSPGRKGHSTRDSSSLCTCREGAGIPRADPAKEAQPECWRPNVCVPPSSCAVS